MEAKVVLNLNDSSALVTVAMLSTMLNERHADYLDIISPFVLTLIPTNIGERIDTSKIITALKDQYGFEQFPIHVLTKILTRYSKQKHGYLEKNHGNFYVKKCYERTGFSESQQKIREAQVAVMEKLQKFLQENSRYKDIAIDRTRELFLLFLEQKGLAFVDGVDGLKTVTSKDYDIFQIARFILAEFELKSSVYYRIEEVVRGFFVYKSIYFFSREGIVSLTEKMKDTTMFFDTRLLIEALGYNSQEGAIAAKELISLIRERGGKVMTYSHLVQEVDGILTAYSKTSNKASFSLQHLLDNNYSEVDVQRLKTSLKIKLNALGIDIIDPVLPRDLSNDNYTPLQINDLSYAIQTAYGLTTQTTRTENDVLSVASIYSARNNARCSSFEDCRAIMVTANLGFATAVHDFYADSYMNNVHFVVSDIDITSVLWLSSWDKKSSLPSIILLENAYAACKPTPNLLTAFSDTIDKLRKEGALTDEEALLLRTQRAPREDLLDLSQNDAGYVTEKSILEIKERYKDSLTEQQNGEITKLQSELRRQKEDVQKRKRHAIDIAEETAQKSADKVEKILKLAVKFGSFIILITGIIALGISQFSTDLAIVWKIILIVLGAFGLIDVFRSRNGFVNKKIILLRNKRFEKVHAKEMQRVLRDFYNL